MDWRRSKLKDQVDHLRGLVNEKLRCSLDDGNTEEVRNALEEIEAMAGELLYGKPGWAELARDPDDGTLLAEERDRVAGLGIETVDAKIAKFMAAQEQLNKVTADNKPVAVAIARDVLNSARAELDEELKKHMTPLEELRKEVIEG